MLRPGLTIFGLMLMTLTACAQPWDGGVQAGDVYQITTDRRASSQGRFSVDRDTIIERVVAIRGAGLELEYDLPQGTSAEDRARSWQFPLRVFKPVGGPLQLLNRSEMETRVDSWLKAANLTRTACGRSYFTWNVFHIACDPDPFVHAIEQIELFPADIRQGAPYRDPWAREPALLTRKSVGSTDEIFVATLVVDPGTVRRIRAESDVVVGEVVRRPVPLDTALRMHSTESISGTITVEFQADPEKHVYRRTKVTTLDIDKPGGPSEHRLTTERLERRLLPSGVPRPR